MNARLDRPQRDLIVEPKPELNCNLPVIDLVVFDVAARFDDLKPMNVVQCLGGFGYGVLRGFFDTVLGRTRQFYLLVNMIVHESSLIFRVQGSNINA
jgi:hypothetical protein